MEMHPSGWTLCSENKSCLVRMVQTLGDNGSSHLSHNSSGQHVVRFHGKRYSVLTHWGRVTHICVSKLTIISSDNGLSPGRRQAIIWTNVGILLFGPPGTNFSEILIEIHTFSFKKMHLKMSSGKWLPFCPGLNVLTLQLRCCTCTRSVLTHHVVCGTGPSAGAELTMFFSKVSSHGC